MRSSDMYAVPQPPSYYPYYRTPYSQPGDVYTTIDDCWSESSPMLPPLLPFGGSHPSPFVSLQPLGEPTYETGNPPFQLHTSPPRRPPEDFTGILQNTAFDSPAPTEPYQPLPSSSIGTSSVGCALAESLATLHNDVDQIPAHNSFMGTAYNNEMPDLVYSSQNINSHPQDQMLGHDVFSDDSFALNTIQPLEVNHRLRSKEHIETSNDSATLHSRRVPPASECEIRNSEFSEPMFENPTANDPPYFSIKNEYADNYGNRVGLSDCEISSFRKFDYCQIRPPDAASASDIQVGHRSYCPPYPEDNFPYKCSMRKRSISSEDSTNRDERRAKELNLPITIDDIINLAIDEYNERLSKYELTEQQLNLIRDIRRRGKNKVAAQNCRKRKMDQINNLQCDLESLQNEKSELKSKQELLCQERQHIEEKYAQLYHTISQYENYMPSNSQYVESIDQLTNPATSEELITDCDSDPTRGTRTKRKLKKITTG